MKKIVISLVGLSLIINPYVAYGNELSIEGNGDGSSSSVNLNVEQNTQVTQNNEAEVDNNVNVDANTGENSASENTGGETSIETGDIDANVNINNENINNSYAEVGCCQGETNIAVTGNGSDSENMVVYTNTSATNVTITNNAKITNNINGTANTGRNIANKNTGSVTIVTGSINVEDSITNKGINVYKVKAVNSGESITVRISDNGDNSDNSVTIINEDNLDISIESSANVVNNSNWDLNTGENIANENTGDVKIATGDIYYKSTITNEEINVGWVDVDCCDEPDKPVDPNPPVSPPGGGGGNGGSSRGNGGSSGDSGSSSGSVLGDSSSVLPATGPSNLLILALALSIMFFMGWYLRLRSGNSPNFAIN